MNKPEYNNFCEVHYCTDTAPDHRAICDYHWKLVPQWLKRHIAEHTAEYIIHEKLYQAEEGEEWKRHGREVRQGFLLQSEAQGRLVKQALELLNRFESRERAYGRKRHKPADYGDNPMRGWFKHHSGQIVRVLTWVCHETSATSDGRCSIFDDRSWTIRRSSLPPGVHLEYLESMKPESQDLLINGVAIWA